MIFLQIDLYEIPTSADEWGKLFYSFPIHIRILMGVILIFCVVITVLFAVILGSRIFKTNRNTTARMIQRKYQPVFTQLLFEDDNRQDSYYNKYVLKTNTKKNDWSDLVRFIQLINDSSGTEAEFQKRLESKFSLHKCLKAWAINNLIGNVDAYNMFYPHNFYIYHDTASSRWHWISLDGNYAFAAWNPILNYEQLMHMNILIPDSVPYRDARPLLTRTLGRNKLIQRQYLLYLREYLNTDFMPENINHMVDSIGAKIRLGVYADPNKMYSNTDFDSNLSTIIGDPTDPGNFIPGLKSYISDRRKYILEQLDVMLKKLE